MRKVRSPAVAPYRIPVGIALTAGGVFGFLPIVGFWMVPLGLAVLAQDVPVMRPPLARLVAKINGKRKPPEPSAIASLADEGSELARRSGYSGLICDLAEFHRADAELQRDRAFLVVGILRAVDGLRAVERDRELRALGA